jgi:hypothetical protein
LPLGAGHLLRATIDRLHRFANRIAFKRQRIDRALTRR